MSLPGFTAEDSLYLSRTRYNLIATKFLAATADIRPQRSKLCPLLEADIIEFMNDFGYYALRGDWLAASFSIHDVNSWLRQYTREGC